MAWHHAQTGYPTGAMGLSLGGYVSAALATFAPELAFAVCLQPAADIPALMWSNGHGTPEQQTAQQAGVTLDFFCLAMSVHAPLLTSSPSPKIACSWSVLAAIA
jgi:hypothetical protein